MDADAARCRASSPTTASADRSLPNSRSRYPRWCSRSCSERGALSAAARQVALQDASADAARLLGRGEGAAAAARVVNVAVPAAHVSSSRSGDLVCVTATTEAMIGSLVRVPQRASSCALDGGL
ncbi:hypothetical protein [Microbacterium sp. Se63.02b]|uniref:hypothetical protein n=1 Tax=Microbacterium sp. Se63.02b TaxID=2709304 RepID=UPI001FCEBE9D|nr:hypothetical protein [Microbacterium sp. Se63.02b]